jgi:L-cysteine desulfidase
MRFSDYLANEWHPALGCTEPACIAYAAASAAAQASGPILSVRLVCDPRMYKNCFAVGIPHSGHKMGLRWALALGALLPDPSARLEVFLQITPAILDGASRLIESGILRAAVDAGRQTLYVDCVVKRASGEGRAVIEGDHTRLMRLERDGSPIPPGTADAPRAEGCWRQALAGLTFEEMIALACSCTEKDRAELRRGAALNLAIARHGQSLLPERFMARDGQSAPARAGRLVCAGVYARMCGEDFSVMSLAGSGNKGITCAVPLWIWGEELGVSQERMEEALALACLITSSTTHQLGTLSAVCGCSNAAGIGLAAGLVYLEGGTAEQISLAVTNMVGNIAGMICDGAKIGCAMKTMTAVDSAFRAAFLALSGVGIPETDGIVGPDGYASLTNLGRVANEGMAAMDREILDIMQAKIAPDA